MRVSRILILILLPAVALAGLLVGSSMGWADGEESTCVSCHTTPRVLIGATREMARERGSGPKVSTEQEGEG